MQAWLNKTKPVANWQRVVITLIMANLIAMYLSARHPHWAAPHIISLIACLLVLVILLSSRNRSQPSESQNEDSTRVRLPVARIQAPAPR
jgi:uncharacterized membrane protein YfcA